ncbi:hypothetical protein M8C21_015019 [Ambrosia artemisiifolia]|uniref:Uncharacterized protein n=1 Tax=Ambrosia artemisiifolia TaxID=4212 RepID=A0AAD5CRX7_AMBAR|nr:hypothetical protein M8C21_015019 [Ambrosia artemisiifolia]
MLLDCFYFFHAFLFHSLSLYLPHPSASASPSHNHAITISSVTPLCHHLYHTPSAFAGYYYFSKQLCRGLHPDFSVELNFWRLNLGFRRSFDEKIKACMSHIFVTLLIDDSQYAQQVRLDAVESELLLWKKLLILSK